MIAILCHECSTEDRVVEFPSLALLDEHVKAGHPIPQGINGPAPWTSDLQKMKTNPPPAPTLPDKAEPVIEKNREPLPIELRYTYHGECPKCFRPIETIEIPVAERSIAVAYCSPCRTQYEKKSLIPIIEQGIDVD